MDGGAGMSEQIVFIVDDFNATVLEHGSYVKIPRNGTQSPGFKHFSFPESIEVTVRVRTTYSGVDYLRSLFQDLSLGDLRL